MTGEGLIRTGDLTRPSDYISGVTIFSYGLPVYGASESDLTSIQNFLDRCYKRRFISNPILMNDLLNKQDCKIFKKAVSVDSHLLCPYIPP